MKQLKLLFTVLFLAVLGLGNVWGAADYTLTPTAGSNNSYAGNCDVTISDITWNVTGNATMVPWRIGGKSITNVDRSVYSKTAYASSVDSIKLTIGAAASVTINKISLVHSTSSDFSNSTTIDAGGKAASTTYTFKPAAGFPKNSYFKFVFNVTIGSSNKFIEFSKVEIYNTPSGSSDPAVSLDATTVDFGTVDQNASVAAKTVKATLTNVTSATAALSGTGADAFSLNTTTLSATGDITITPNTTVAGTYEATLTLSATDATSATATIKMTVTAPFTGETWEIAASDLVILDNSQSSTYLKYAGTQTKDGINYNITAVMPQTGNMQLQKANGVIYNETSFGKIAKVTVASSNSFKMYEGAAKAPSTEVTGAAADGVITYNFSGNNGYFKLVNATSGAATVSKITVYYYPVKSAITLATCENGSVGASATSDVKAGTTVTLSNTPATGYKFDAYDVYKTGDAATKVTVTDGKFTMPAYPVTVSATFVPARTLTGIEINTENVKKVFYLGETFNSNNLVVTAKFDGSADEDVTADASVSTPDLTTTGTKVVTVSYTEGVEKTATYNIEVKTIANTKATAYTVADALKIIKLGVQTETEIYVKGIVITASAIGTYGNSNIDIKDAETDGTNFVRCYRCLDLGNKNFTEDYVGVGDTVIVIGKPYDYVKSGVHTYELNTGCYLVEYKKFNQPKTDISNTPETAYTAAQAIALYNDATSDLTKAVYVKGVVASKPSLTASGDWAGSYYQVTEENGFVFFHMYQGPAKAQFTEDIVGVKDTLIAYGTLTKYNSTYELENCYMYSRKAYVATPETVVINETTPSVEVNSTITLTATVTPAAAANKNVTWAVIEGSAYASVDAATGVVTGLAEGTATVQVTTVVGGKTATVEVAVIAVDTRKTATNGESAFEAISGSLNSDITFEARKGNASTAPYLTNGVIRLYQNGGYVMLSAVKGCKIDEVIVSTTSTYTTTTVGYSVNDAALATTGTTAAASSEWKTAKGLNADSVKVICLGTTSSTRLEFSKLTVKYTGEPATVASLALSGTYTTNFAKGAEFEHDGMTVTATYSDQSTADVTDNAIFSEPDMNTVGEQTVTVSFGGKETTYTINIAPATVTELVLTGEYQKIFAVGDTFNHDNLVVTANYSDGTNNDVTAEATFSTPDMSQVGSQEITVSFGGKSATYTISVKATSGSMTKESVDFTETEPYASMTTGSVDMAAYSGASFDMAFAKKTGTNNAPKYYFNGTAVRCYTDNTITITAVDPILAVDIVNLQNKDGYATTGGYTISGLETETVVITFSETRRFTSIIVHYAPEAVRANLTVGKMGTICYGYDLVAIEGATFYEPEYFDGTYVGFKEATEVKAGYGYLYVAEATELKAVKLGTEVTTAVEDAPNHMQGVLADDDNNLPEGNGYCGVKNNHLQYFGANNTMTAGHAYIVLVGLPASKPVDAPVSARRLRVGPAGVTTGLEFNDAEVEAQKLLINGEIYIVRGGHVYNAAGLLVK